MATKKESTVKTEDTEVQNKVPSTRIHIDEFLNMHPNMSNMSKAAFRATSTKVWMYLEEWEQIYKKLIR